MHLSALLLSTAFILGGCASKKYGDEKVETRLDAGNNKTSEKFGFDKERNLVMQEKTSATDELMIQTHVNEELRSKLQHEYQQLRRCRVDLADVRLGGSGEMAPMPEIDGLATDKAYKETVGFDESGELVFIRQEKFEDKIKAEKTAETTMRRLQKVITSNKNNCELRMRKARVENGLPAERTPPVIRYEGGQAVIVQPAEQSLDDAFRFANQAKEQ
jgi:hypothetical protein